MAKKNLFNIYSSKVKRFNIPLPGFKYFHRSSSEEIVDSKFIGRDKSSKQLYSWLMGERTRSGSYLITGYRGMGKSSFVGRILYEISIRVTGKTSILGLLSFVLIWIGSGLSLVSGCSLLIPILLITSGLLILICIYHRFVLIDLWRRINFIVRILILQYLDNQEENSSEKLKIKDFLSLFKKGNAQWERINKEIYNTNIREKSYKRICISINLGQEILNERDVLCLFAHQLYVKYKEYIFSPLANYRHWLIHTLVILVCVIVVLPYIFSNIQDKMSSFLDFLNLKNTDQNIIILVLLLLFFIVVYTLFYFLSSSLFPFSQRTKLNRLRFLIDRIDSQIELENTLNMSMMWKKDEKQSGFNIGNKSRKKYPLADTKAIEQELIDILESISRGLWSPSFIFVFDELDKVESENKQQSTGDLEYINEKYFPGGGTSRKRKQNVLHLLANMKLFISSARVKFIFIAGRELYDAYLADLSDREFSISSIFSGIIYVESFCSNERREKDIMSNAETYICKQLIPRDYIIHSCCKSYIKACYEGKKFEQLDINLKMYYKYLMTSYVDLLSDLSEVEKNSLLRDIRDCVDKAIVLLYHFSVYLYHISNGSPKKMCLYFEKYIRTLHPDNDLTFAHWDRSISVLQEKNINIRIKCNANFCLSFGYLEQRLIGFIHYISFPVTQIIINANQFGDKLLVSASFLINHIYKFHKGGFSWRNMEQTPELLEVYRIPEFRSFIDSILSYLSQTHIIPITCGLYQFKFRKQFSEEISLASKFSEEIAALFNFTLDEALSIKEHYMSLLDYYNRLSDKEHLRNAHVIAGIHVILGDLFMADEEYTKAIFEYQAGINIMFEENIKNKDNINDQHAITRILFLIRNMLKLGLAFEKRKTYESAYVTYNELIGRLIDFRYLDEYSLGLNYAIKTVEKGHEAVLYAGDNLNDEPILNKKVCPKINNKLDDNKLNCAYTVNGSDIIADFGHQMTPEKNQIIQRLSMLEDIRLIYQAVLAKLFVLEKIELGGITRGNIELLESEYVFLHLATNEKNKFLISNDFFRRLGDIMFYKNGLTKEFYTGIGKTESSFIDGLYLWSYNARTEILDFCNENNCYDVKEELLDKIYRIKDNDITKDNIEEKLGKVASEIFLKRKCPSLLKTNDLLKKIVPKFVPESELMKNFENSIIQKIVNLPIQKILDCNKHRNNLWTQNRHLPCFACKYYNKSLRLLLKNLFDVDLEQECKNKDTSKVFTILQVLVDKGTSKSLRQNFLTQLAEILDCMGNVMLSCTSTSEGKESIYYCNISRDFLSSFLNDILDYNTKNAVQLDSKKFSLFTLGKITMLERCLIYYWEAYICFRLSNDPKKAAGSLKKILRTIQNYLKLDYNDKNEKDGKRLLIGEFLGDIKNRIVKQSLIHLYAHYNYMNIIEIQKLKWIFYVQMYESISLSRLSLFPDVEEIMLIYYEIMARCIIEQNNEACNGELKKDCSWKTLYERNTDFRIRMTGIYRNIALGSLRQESTIYERILSLRFKANMNQRILHHLFFVYDGNQACNYYSHYYFKYFMAFLQNYLHNSPLLTDKLGEYKYCFLPILKSSKNAKPTQIALDLLEFLITDSIYCLTRILEIITPYTSTTLFTNTFLGEIYQKLFEWNQVFDVLYMTYRASETNLLLQKISINCNRELDSDWQTGIYSDCSLTESKCDYIEKFLISDEQNVNNNTNRWKSKCPYYGLKCSYKLNQLELIASELCNMNILFQLLKDHQKDTKIDIAETFFNDILKEIGKSNIHYTLSNYSIEMALKFYRQALDVHHEGKSYKNIISKMYYLDDDLKNDTIQFDLALERFRINNDYVQNNIEKILKVFRNASIYDIENFCMDNETKLSIKKRFQS